MTSERPKILFVDDEENILKAITRLFLDEPLEVLTAGSGDEGLALLRANGDIAVIVSDQRMPAMSGAEFLSRARETAPDAVRIVLTGYADVKAAVDAINRGGAYRYIGKPWNDEELIALVRDAASRYGLVQENRQLTAIVHRQNEELKKWNSELETLVQQQTIDIQKQNRTLETLNERLRRNFSDTLQAFAGLIELRDKSAGSHSRNVSELAGSMARLLKLPPEETGAIVVAALLHDIGKIGIPDALLTTKSEAMTQADLALYMTHPVRGQAAVDTIEDLHRSGVLIRHHHEAWNGTGFPDRLRGDAIPIGSRIIGLADFFDRAVSSFSGEEACDNALRAVTANLDRRFDPGLYEALEQCVAPMRQAQVRAPKSVEMELRPGDLKEGMVLAREVRSGTGVLLLNAGTTLTLKAIEAINRFFQIDPARENVFVALRGN